MLKRRNEQGDGEIEILNADIMRFIAIIALLLMISFAILVSQKKDNNSKQLNSELIENNQQLTKENQQIKARLEYLQSQNKQHNKEKWQTLQSQNQAIKADLQQSEQQNQQLNQINQKIKAQVQQLQAQNKQLKKGSEQSQKWLSKLSLKTKENRQLKYRLQQSIQDQNKVTEKIQSLQNQLDQVTQTLSTKEKAMTVKMQYLQSQLNQTKQKKNRLQAVLVTQRQNLQHQLDQKNQQLAAKEQQKSQQTVVKTVKKQQKGFSLSFTTDQAFQQLVKQQKIELIYQKNKLNYQVLDQNTPRLIKKTGDLIVYKLATETVPKRYKQAFTQGSNITWSVVLPPNIVKSIQNIMELNQGGALEIDKNGHCRLIQ